MTYDYYDSTFEAPYDDGDASPYDDWTHGELQAELERTEHDLAVAVHEATAARRRLAEITDPGADRVASIVRVDTTDDVTLELIRRVLWDVGGWVEMDHAASVAVARAIAAALREHVPNQEQHP